jgi:hypothetical protein
MTFDYDLKHNRYLPHKPFAACDRCTRIYPWTYKYCSRCQNDKLRYEGSIPDIHQFDMTLDDSGREPKI